MLCWWRWKRVVSGLTVFVHERVKFILIFFSFPLRSDSQSVGDPASNKSDGVYLMARGGKIMSSGQWTIIHLSPNILFLVVSNMDTFLCSARGWKINFSSLIKNRWISFLSSRTNNNHPSTIYHLTLWWLLSPIIINNRSRRRLAQ